MKGICFILSGGSILFFILGSIGAIPISKESLTNFLCFAIYFKLLEMQNS